MILNNLLWSNCDEIHIILINEILFKKNNYISLKLKLVVSRFDHWKQKRHFISPLKYSWMQSELTRVIYQWSFFHMYLSQVLPSNKLAHDLTSSTQTRCIWPFLIKSCLWSRLGYCCSGVRNAGSWFSTSHIYINIHICVRSHTPSSFIYGTSQ